MENMLHEIMITFRIVYDYYYIALNLKNKLINKMKEKFL